MTRGRDRVLDPTPILQSGSGYERLSISAELAEEEESALPAPQTDIPRWTSAQHLGLHDRGIAVSRPLIMRYAERNLGFLAGLLVAGVAIGIAYRYLFDPLEERTLPFYIRSSVHAIGLTCSGWAVHLAFAAIRRSRLGSAVRRLPLAAEFAIKALIMTAVLTIVAVGLQAVLYPFPVSKQWVADELPRIIVIAFTAALLIGAIFEFRRLVGGRVLGSFLLGTYHRPKREQRVVMFLDIQSSTALAERMGEVRVHDLITQFFFDIDEPIAEHGGEVHSYVGDAVIVTWPLEPGPGAKRPRAGLFLRR